jgi:hypothetical protein
MPPVTRAFVLPAALLLAAAGILTVVLPSVSSAAATTTLCGLTSAPVDGGAYTLDNDEWGSKASECVATNGNAEFRVANSSIENGRQGKPGGYPDLYKGCTYGACTADSGLPLRVSAIHADTVTTSWRTHQIGGSSIYNVAYDIWFNRTPSTSGEANGAELMIWLYRHGPKHPYGTQVASDVSIGGHTYNVWFGDGHGINTVSFWMTSRTTSVRDLRLRPLIADAMQRGYIRRSWYLIDVEAGFEIWRGGAGLATKSFAVTAR